MIEKPEVRPNMRAGLRLLLCKGSENIKRKLELDKMGGHIIEAAGSTFFFGIEKLFSVRRYYCGILG